jgi:hypothetical protein
MEDKKKKGWLKCFYSVFRDDNNWNEKTIVGFMAFAVMVSFAFADLLTGYFGKDLVITDTIYDSFFWLVVGCFGIDGVQRVFNKNGQQGQGDSDIN